MPSATRAADSTLASELRLGVMRLARRLRSERTETSLTLSQLATLATLDRHGSLSPGALAAHERVQPPSMTPILAGLEERALVVRRRHPTDRRQALVELSAAGRALLAADRRRRDEWLGERLAELPADEIEDLRRAAAILDRLASA